MQLIMDLNKTESDYSCDINDAFDNILLSEESLNREGYVEGYEKGLINGEKDGYHLGYHRGAEIGSLIGYFKGFADVLIKQVENRTDSKVYHNLSKFKVMVYDFPKANREDVDLIGALESIKGLFKIICTQIKISPAIPDMKELSF